MCYSCMNSVHCSNFSLFVPGTSSAGSMKTCIFHVDMDCFFVSVGIRHRTELKGKSSLPFGCTRWTLWTQKNTSIKRRLTFCLCSWLNLCYSMQGSLWQLPVTVDWAKSPSDPAPTIRWSCSTTRGSILILSQVGWCHPGSKSESPSAVQRRKKAVVPKLEESLQWGKLCIK